jgi:hypothetical protein
MKTKPIDKDLSIRFAKRNIFLIPTSMNFTKGNCSFGARQQYLRASYLTNKTENKNIFIN